MTKRGRLNSWTTGTCLFIVTALIGFPVVAQKGGQADGLRTLHTKAEKDSIVKALSSEDPRVVLAALKEAKGIFRKDFKNAVVTCLDHSDPVVRSLAFEFVLPCEIQTEYARLAKRLAPKFPGRIHYTDAGGSETDLGCPNGSVVRQFELLGKAAIPVITQTLKSDDVNHRLVAINLLGKTRSPEVLPALKKMLSDEKPAVRRRAVRAMGYLNDKAAMDCVYSLTNDEDTNLVFEAAVALSQQQDERALSVWQDMMRKDKERYSLSLAFKWLSRFENPKVIPILVEGLNHPTENARYCALDALKKLTLEDHGFNQDLWRQWHDQHEGPLPGHFPFQDPGKPLRKPLVELGRTSTYKTIEHLSVDGNLLFAGGRAYLFVFDITDITKPEKIGSYWISNSIDQMACSNGRLFLATHHGSLYAYRYTKQGDLEHLSKHSDVKSADSFLMQGDRLLLRSGAEVALYDISEDGPPRLLDKQDAMKLRPFSLSGDPGYFTTANWRGDKISTSMAFPIRTVQRYGRVTVAEGNRIYCIDSGILNVRDFDTGRRLGSANVKDTREAKLFVRGKWACALLEHLGIVIFDVSDPAKITVSSHTSLPEQSREQLRAHYRGLCVTGKHLFCASYGGEVFIFELPDYLRDER